MTQRLLCALFVVLVAIAGLAIDSPPAAACSCDAPTTEEFLDGAVDNPRWVIFTGRQISTTNDGPQWTLTFSVGRVFLGDITGETIDIRNDEDSCGGGPVRPITGTFVGWRNPNTNDVDLGKCIGSLSTTLVETYFDGFPEPTPRGTPGFVVAHRLADSRLAVLNRRGELMGYQRNSNGSPIALTSCPEGEHVVVASVNLPSSTYRGSLPVRFDTLRADDLSLLATRTANLGWRNDRLQRGIEDFQCHDPLADRISYSQHHRTFRAGTIDLHMWDGNEHSLIEFEKVRDIALNPQGTRVVSLGRLGRTLTSHDVLSANTTDSIDLPNTHVAWHLDIARNGRVFVLARHEPIIGPNRRVPIVNRIVRTTLRAGNFKGMSGRPLGTAQEIGSDIGVGIDGPGSIVSGAYVDGSRYVVKLSFKNRIFLYGPKPSQKSQLRIRRASGPIAFGPKATMSGYVYESGIGKVTDQDPARLRSIDGVVGGYLVVATR